MRKPFILFSSRLLICCLYWSSGTTTTTTSALAAYQQTRRRYFGDSVAGIVASGVASGATTCTAAEVDKTLFTLLKSFPSALPNDQLLDRVGLRLGRLGFKKDKTLVASSLCSDEVNRPLEETFRKYYGDRYFAMGGLAGFPFSGITGFGAMASHIPDGGDCLLVYGPHVGVDSAGNVGKVDRRGKSKAGTCCGSSVAASKYLAQVVAGEADPIDCPPPAALDAQQVFVSTMLLPYAAEITSAEEPMVTLPYAAFRPIDIMMKRIVTEASSKVGDGKIAMLGGLQINTPDGISDYFLPLRFDVRDNTNAVVDDLLVSIKSK